MTTMKHSGSDRCDRDSAQAYTTWLRDDHTLSFCGHHSREYAPALEAQGFVLTVDDLGILDALHGRVRDAASAV